VTLNFVTIFAASCLTLSVAIPGGLYVAGKVQSRLAPQGSSRAEAESLWITTPPFTLMDESGERHRMIAAVGTRNKEEAARLCKYLPIVRDRLQRFASAVRVVGSEGGQPSLRGNANQLAEDLADALGLHGAPDVRIIESNYSVQQVLQTKPSTCEKGRPST